MSKIKHIAVIRLSAMGDVAMTVPVLRAFAERYPEIKITCVSRAFFAPLFRGIPNVEFFAFDSKDRHKGFWGLLRLFSDLKKLEIDAFADLHNVLRTKIVSGLFALSGIKTATVDKARAEKKALRRSENKIFKQLLPITERHAKVFDELGFPIDLSNPIFPTPPNLNGEIKAVTGEKQNNKWIGIAPFAQHDAKVYPKDLLHEVVETLAGEKSNMIFLFGATNELDQLNAFSRNDNVVILAGKLTFEQELQLIANLDVMLSMDSGNAHIAAMYGVKVITLWGATHPYSGFAPFNQPFENALVSDREKYPLLPTSIYGNKKVEGYEDAMRTIAPEKVIEKIKSILN